MDQLKYQIKSKMKALYFAPLQLYFVTMMQQIFYALRTITNESYRLIMPLKKKQSLFSPEHTNLQVTHKLKQQNLSQGRKLLQAVLYFPRVLPINNPKCYFYKSYLEVLYGSIVITLQYILVDILHGLELTFRSEWDPKVAIVDKMFSQFKPVFNLGYQVRALGKC